MGLIQPSGPDWAYCSHNISGTPAIGTIGTQMTAQVASTDGTPVTVLSALAHDVEYLRLLLSTSSQPTGTDNNALMTLLIDPAGGTSWQTLIPYLYVGGLMHTGLGQGGSGSGAPSGAYDFPIWIPAGASVGAMARTAHPFTSVQTIHCFAQAYGGNRNPASWWCGQRVSAIGIDAANSRGTSHTPGNAGSFSSWASLGGALAADCGALQFVSGGEHSYSAGWNENLYQMELGVGSQRIGPPLMRLLTTAENGWWAPTGPIFKRLPAGTQLQIRGTASGTAESITTAAYAVH